MDTYTVEVWSNASETWMLDYATPYLALAEMEFEANSHKWGGVKLKRWTGGQAAIIKQV